MAVLGLCFSARAFSSCGKRGPLFIAVRGPLALAASPVAEHRLQTRRLSNCGSRAQPLRSVWDLPRPGLEPVSPALAGVFSTTAPPGKPQYLHFNSQFWRWEGPLSQHKVLNMEFHDLRETVRKMLKNELFNPYTTQKRNSTQFYAQEEH